MNAPALYAGWECPHSVKQDDDSTGPVDDPPCPFDIVFDPPVFEVPTEMIQVARNHCRQQHSCTKFHPTFRQVAAVGGYALDQGDEPTVADALTPIPDDPYTAQVMAEQAFIRGEGDFVTMAKTWDDNPQFAREAERLFDEAKEATTAELAAAYGDGFAELIGRRDKANADLAEHKSMTLDEAGQAIAENTIGRRFSEDVAQQTADAVAKVGDVPDSIEGDPEAILARAELALTAARQARAEVDGVLARFTERTLTLGIPLGESADLTALRFCRLALSDLNATDRYRVIGWLASPE